MKTKLFLKSLMLTALFAIAILISSCNEDADIVEQPELAKATTTMQLLTEVEVSTTKAGDYVRGSAPAYIHDVAISPSVKVGPNWMSAGPELTYAFVAFGDEGGDEIKILHTAGLNKFIATSTSAVWDAIEGADIVTETFPCDLFRSWNEYGGDTLPTIAHLLAEIAGNQWDPLPMAIKFSGTSDTITTLPDTYNNQMLIPMETQETPLNIGLYASNLVACDLRITNNNTSDTTILNTGTGLRFTGQYNPFQIVSLELIKYTDNTKTVIDEIITAGTFDLIDHQGKLASIVVKYNTTLAKTEVIVSYKWLEVVTEVIEISD